MDVFTRTLDEQTIESLLNRESDSGRIFCDYPAPRIKCGEIFIAIRNNKIDFYVWGSRFLEYSGNGFKAKVFPVNWEKSFDKYIQKSVHYSAAKSDQAERKIMQAYFPVYDKQNKVVVLDREIRINDGNGKKCDWLLYNTETCELKFVEVKISDHPS